VLFRSDDNGKRGLVLGQKRGLKGFWEGVITTEMGENMALHCLQVGLGRGFASRVGTLDACH
jgi:hypothetical protein